MGAGALGLTHRVRLDLALLLLAAAAAAPRAARAAWRMCWFDDHHDHKLFHSPAFQATETQLLRNQTIFEANVYISGSTTTPETTCSAFPSQAAAEAQIATLRQQARADGDQPIQVPAE